jgi:hypothetical protein
MPTTFSLYKIFRSFQRRAKRKLLHVSWTQHSALLLGEGAAVIEIKHSFANSSEGTGTSHLTTLA